MDMFLRKDAPLAEFSSMNHFFQRVSDVRVLCPCFEGIEFEDNTRIRLVLECLL